MEYIEEYKKILFFIEDLQREIDSLKYDIDVCKNKIGFLENKINSELVHLEDTIKILVDKKEEIKSNIILANNLKRKIKNYLCLACMCLLATSCSFVFNLSDINIFIKFLTAISASLIILFGCKSIIVLVDFIKIKKNINNCDLDNLDMKIDCRKKELERAYSKNSRLLFEKKKLEKILEDNFKKISNLRRKMIYLNKEKDRLSNLVLTSIYDDVIISYEKEIEGQLVIPGIKTLVKRNVDNM